MTSSPFVPPSFRGSAFNCPHCGAYSGQIWQELYRREFPGGGYIKYYELQLSWCTHCQKFAHWHGSNMIYPGNSGVPFPNPDLSDDIRQDYLEAASIVNVSPRGSTALLRLCIQKLCAQLGEKGENINTDIGALVKKGMPPTIQQALDIVRVIGNNAVHPGQIDLKDDRDTAMKLFDLINVIAEDRISTPKRVEEMYKSIVPENVREQINKRDQKEPT